MMGLMDRYISSMKGCQTFVIGVIILRTVTRIVSRGVRGTIQCNRIASRGVRGTMRCNFGPFLAPHFAVRFS